MEPGKRKSIVTKYVLQNAVFYNGKADPKAVMGKVMASEPELRKQMKEVRKDIDEIIRNVNQLGAEEQKNQLVCISPDLLKKEIKIQEGLPPLRDAVEHEVVTRFAPSPTGPLSIFQLSRAVMISYLYAKQYKGKFMVRIEDTDASRIEKRYYGMIEEDLKNVGVEWDKIILQSDHIPVYYRHAENLIKDGKIYACFCSAEGFRELKKKKQNCPCRDYSPKENHTTWLKAKEGKYGDGEVVFRMKSSMHDPNPVMRDPPLLRINRIRHPLKGTKYKIWPLYNFSCTIDDHIMGITHVFRGKEHEHNTAVQKRIYETLGWNPPVTINFGMIYLPGEKFHTRDVAEMIKSGKISGWDDPNLPSVRALLRRGFRPETFKLFATQCSLTKHDINVDWETFYGINRRVIDPDAERYRVVANPVPVDVGGCVKDLCVGDSVMVQKHPDRKDTRKIPVTKKVYVSRDDFKKFKGKKVRLIDLFNVNLDRNTKSVKSQAISDNMQKIQWVPEGGVDVKILKPGEKGGELNGIGEPEMKNLKVGDVIQMIRIGFGRIDKKNRAGIQIVFAHK
jgi:glutamyl-tRNA synthetase